MSKIKRHITLATLLIMIGSVAHADSKKKVEFIGGARSVVQNAQLSVTDTVPDTVTSKKNSGGYALIDLGVEIRPNDQTEIMAMFRIRNEFGGFWGAGVTFDIRQMWLKGVLGNVLKYQVGDLNLKSSPFTLYNHHADRIDSLPEIFKIQNDIISYENFYSPNNTWRQQGLAFDFGLSFSKIIKEMDFEAYVTRLRATDFSSTPDRLMPGGSVDMWVNDDLALGYNINTVVDIPGTVNDTMFRYQNVVQSLDLKYKRNFGDDLLKINAELGNGRSQYEENSGSTTLKDNFLYAQAEYKAEKINSDFSLGYINVGPEFRSIGAQTKDINYEVNSVYYPTFTDGKIDRPVSIYDVVSNTDFYGPSLNSRLMTYSPIYNNVLPYGIATFNRTGLLFGYTFHPRNIQIDFRNHRLSEVRGQGTRSLRQFNSAQILTRFDVQGITGLKRKLNLNLGTKIDNTWRPGLSVLDEIDLSTLQLQAGIDWEVYDNIDLLGGLIIQSTSGNEFKTDRDSYTIPTYFTNQKYDLQQSYYSGGVRYRFNEEVHLTALYQQNTYENKIMDMPDYSTGNFMILFNMTF